METKKQRKRPWTPKERAAINQHLAKFIALKKVPRKDVRIKCHSQASPDLQDRTWMDIKYFVHNEMSKIQGKKCILKQAWRWEREMDSEGKRARDRQRGEEKKWGCRWRERKEIGEREVESDRENWERVKAQLLFCRGCYVGSLVGLWHSKFFLVCV